LKVQATGKNKGNPSLVATKLNLMATQVDTETDLRRQVNGKDVLQEI
jgi:hypothetical protein